MKITETCKLIYPQINPETIRVWINRGIFSPSVIQTRPTREGSDLDTPDLVVVGVLSAFHRCGGRFKIRKVEMTTFIEPPFEFDRSALRESDMAYFSRQKLRGRDVQAYLELLQFRTFARIMGRLNPDDLKPLWSLSFGPLEKLPLSVSEIIQCGPNDSFCFINCLEIWKHVQELLP